MERERKEIVRREGSRIQREREKIHSEKRVRKRNIQGKDRKF